MSNSMNDTMSDSMNDAMTGTTSDAVHGSLADHPAGSNLGPGPAATRASAGGVVTDDEGWLRARILDPAPGAVDWVSVCPLTWIVPGSGVAAMVADEQVAVFRLDDDRLYAVANRDPFSDTQVLTRGIVGDRDGTPCVFSPMYRHAFSLETGTCLDLPDIHVTAYPARLVGRIVFVGRWL